MLWRTSFAAYSMHLKLKREVRTITWRWDKARWELDYRIVNKIMCSLESAYDLFQKCVILDAQNQGTELA